MTLVLAQVQDDPDTTSEDVGDSSELWDSEEEPATDEGTEAESAEPAVPTVPTTTTDTKAKYEEPSMKGIGLLSTTIGLGASALVIGGARMGMNFKIIKDCEQGDPACGSLTTGAAYWGLAATQWTLGVAATGIAPGAGVLMGRYAAWKAAVGEGPQRKPKVIIGTGAGLLSAGVVALGASMAMGIVMPLRCADQELSSGDGLSGDRCYARRFPLWNLTNWAGFSMAAAGGALIGYGVSYKNYSTRRYSWTISPYGGFGSAGLAVSGQF